MMIIHEGRYLGKPLVPVYVLLTGLGLAGIIFTGINMLINRRGINQNDSQPTKLNPRSMHLFLAPVFSLPLIISALTGIAYRLGKAWFGLSAQQAKFFLNIHQGNYFGSSLRAFYVLLIGLGLLAILATGIQMKGLFRSRRSN